MGAEKRTSERRDRRSPCDGEPCMRSLASATASMRAREVAKRIVVGLIRHRWGHACKPVTPAGLSILPELPGAALSRHDSREPV